MYFDHASELLTFTTTLIFRRFMLVMQVNESELRSLLTNENLSNIKKGKCVSVCVSVTKKLCWHPIS